MSRVYIEKAALDLRLCAPKEQDMEILRTMLNDPRIEYSVTGWGLPVSATEQMNWFYEILPGRDTIQYLMIEKGSTVIGCLVLDKLDREMKTGEIGIKILRQYQGTRTTVDAARLFLEYCFRDLGLECLYGYCLALQLATLRLVKLFGFTEEGRQRSAIYKHGERHDIIHFSLLKQDFEKRAAR